MQMNKCRCGANPKIAASDEIADRTVYAIHCEQMCGDDSHWQMSLTEAVTRWNAGLVRAASGGNGSRDQDFQKLAQAN